MPEETICRICKRDEALLPAGHCQGCEDELRDIEKEQEIDYDENKGG